MIPQLLSWLKSFTVGKRPVRRARVRLNFQAEVLDVRALLSALAPISATDATGVTTTYPSGTGSPPTISAPAKKMIEQGAYLTFSGSKAIVVSDPGGTADSQMQMTVTDSQGILLIQTFGLTDSTGESTTDLMVAGPLSSLNTELATLQYMVPTYYAGADTIYISVTDTATGLTGTAIVAITVTLPPTITAPVVPVDMNQGDTLALDTNNSIIISDPSGTTEKLVVSATYGTINLGTTTGLTVTGNGTSQLTATGQLASLNNALPSLTHTPYANYWGNADAVTLTVQDLTNGLAGSSHTPLLHVHALPPTITVPATVSLNQGSSLSFAGSNSISVTDVNGPSEKFVMSVVHGALTLATTTGLTVTGNGTSAVTITGALSSLNADLASLKYTPTSNYHGTDSLSLTDLNTVDALRKTASVAITIKPVAPTITAPTMVGLSQGSSLSFTGSSAISVTDPSGTAEKFVMSVSHGTLTLSTTTGLTVTGNGTSPVTVSGTLSNLNTALASLKYSPTSTYHGTDSLSLTNLDTVDGLRNTISVAITVNLAAPTITAPSTVSLNQGSSLSWTGSNAISVIDHSGTAEKFVMSVSHGTLTFGTTTGLTVTGNGTSAVTVTGTLSSLNTDLASLRYTPASTYHGTDSLSLIDLDTSNGLRNTVRVAIVVNLAPPTITAPSTVSLNQGGSLSWTGSNSIRVTDPSGTAEKFVMSVSHGTLTLGTTAGLTVTGNGTSAVTVTGTLSSLNADLASLVYTPASTYHGADLLSLIDLDTSDGLRKTVSVVITVNPS